MSKKTKQIRKAIFVSEETFEKFRESALADGRKYDPFLNKLLDNKKDPR